MNRYGILFAVLALLSSTSMAGPLMYIPSGNANDILIVDLETDSIIGRIDELENAHGLSSSPNTEYLVAGSMKPMNSDAPASPGKPAVVSEAEHAAHHAAAGSAPSSRASYLSIVHPKHGHVMRRVAVRGLVHHTAVSPDGKYTIAVHSGSGGISVVSLETMSVIKTIATGQWPNYAVFSKNGDRLFVSNSGSNSISEIDTHNWKITRQLKAGRRPEHLVLGVAGKMLYSANKDDASVSAIDLASGLIKKTFDVGNKPHGIDVSDDGRWLFVASKQDGVVTRISLANGDFERVGLKPSPYHLAYINNMNKVYVSSRKEAKIWVLDAATLAVKKSIDLKKGVAHQMVIRNE